MCIIITVGTSIILQFTSINNNSHDFDKLSNIIVISLIINLKRNIIPITLDTLMLMWSICLFHFKFEDMISPRNLKSVTLSIVILLIFKSEKMKCSLKIP